MKRELAKLVGDGFYLEALSLFSRFHSRSHPINNFTFPSLFKACAKLKTIPQGQMLHTHLIKTGFLSDVHAATSLTAMYMKFRFLDSALKVFDEGPEPNLTSLNVVISGFSQLGYRSECFKFFRLFGEYGLRPDSYTIVSILCACEGAVKDGIQVHCWAVKIGVEADVYTATSLVTMYSNCKHPVSASLVFEAIQDRNTACYNAFLTGLLQNGICDSVLEVFKRMRMRGPTDKEPSSVTFVVVLSACSELESLKFGRQIHGFLVKVDLQFDMLVGTALLDMYSKCGYWHWAYDVFKELRGVRSLITWNCLIAGMMLNGESENAVGLFALLESEGLKPDSATWNSMISGFSQLGKGIEAFCFFRRMLLTGVSPCTKSITSVLTACASISAFGSGKEIHAHIIRNSIDHDVFIETALVDMYMKCGLCSWALRVFDQLEIKPRDPVIWNAMISGYGRNGESEAAFRMFELMQKENIPPNLSTFNIILSVCSHSGQIGKGLDIFSSIIDYGLAPTSEHYACIIDILCRAGRIDEARELLAKFPELLASGLASLLGTSKFNLDSKLGEEMAKMLLELEPKNPLPFVILSNIYAEQGRWKDVEEMREGLNKRGLKKIPGLSSVNAK